MTKYRAVKTAGYASKGEAKRAQELQLLERMGKISNLRFQVKVELIPKQDGERACNWIMDFMYEEDGEEIWEDFKGFRTPEYIIKRKLVLWRYGKKVRETR